MANTDKEDIIKYWGKRSLFLVLALWGLNGLLYWYGERGTFGDMFGAVNALFSGLALAGIIISIQMQSNELALQREELALTRDELAATRAEFEQQNETMIKQRFENTFFHLVDLFHEIVTNLYYSQRGGNKTYEKREVFIKASHELKGTIINSRSEAVNKYRRENGNYSSDLNLEFSNEEEYGFVKEGYFSFYGNFSDSLGHYFRHLYHIFKYIYQSELTLKEKKFYASLIRAQLSQSELILIFYNSMIEGLGNPKFLFLIREFDILQNFNYDLIARPIDREIHQKLMDEVINPFLAE
ncbi:hypothetical protein GCM10028805_57460 [Spirosoma harenae]